jgi:trans-aconitate methyltransferase
MPTRNIQQPINHWNAQLYNDKHAFVYDYGRGLVDLLAPKSHERILDLGCGSGELTAKIDESANKVIGIDKSPEMIAHAKVQFPSCVFQVADATDFGFDEPFDAIFSNATLHWVLEQKEAIDRIYANLAKGGRMIVEFGGKHNVKAITDALCRSLSQWGYVGQADLKLWYFPSIGEYTTALETQGFTVTFAQWYDRPTELGGEKTGIIDWLRMFAKPFFDRIPDEDAIEIRKEIQHSLRDRLFKNGKWYADYKRIRIVAIKQFESSL